MTMVSVVMACHDSSRYLEEAVNSVLNQTFRELELILIDDCSTDDTLEIANRYRDSDDRVSVLSLAENLGPAAARNAGIRASKGKWLGILDSDDVAAPTRFESQVRLAESDDNLVMIGSSAISINENGEAIRMHAYPASHRELVKRLAVMRAVPPHSSLLYRKEDVVKLSGYNSRYVPSEDYDLWLRLSEIGKLACIDEPLVRIRKHRANISNMEGGVRQLRMGIAAAACHFLRAEGQVDPSISERERTWEDFISWIDRRIRQEGLPEKRQVWADARSAFLEARNRLTGVLRFGTRLLQSHDAGALLWERIAGTSLPRRLAKEWMTRV